MLFITVIYYVSSLLCLILHLCNPAGHGPFLSGEKPHFEVFTKQLIIVISFFPKTLLLQFIQIIKNKIKEKTQTTKICNIKQEKVCFWHAALIFMQVHLRAMTEIEFHSEKARYGSFTSDPENPQRVFT